MEFVKAMVSVIIPVYNAEAYLRDIMTDLTNQSYQNMEIIVIDDGSQDGSAGIIQAFAEKDNRIQYIHIPNGGPSKARNIGLGLARGEYIRFIDADDRITSDSMRNMFLPFEENSDIDLVMGNYSTDADNRYFTGEEIEAGFVDSETFAEIFIKHIKTFYFGVPWNKLYKRDIIEQYQIRFNEAIIWCEDFLFNVEYFSKCKKMYFLNVPQGVYQYCTRENGITASISKTSLEEIDKIDKLRYQWMQKYCAAYGLQEIFELEWKYANLYENLTTITRYFRNDTLGMKYQKFKECISGEGAYQYISIKCKETHYKVWHLLKEACEKQKYRKAFLVFILKGFQYKYIRKWFLRTEMSIMESEIKKL